MHSTIPAKEQDYLTVIHHLYRLQGRYPFLDVRQIGKSVLGRGIPALQLGYGSDRVLYAGGFHGCERLTVLMLLRFAEELCAALDGDMECAGIRARTALLGHSLTIVPLVNPDGYEIALKGPGGAGKRSSFIAEINGERDIAQWNANAAGVDINHNFDAGWDILHKMEAAAGITGPAPRQYGGQKPHDQPETQALVNLCYDCRFLHALAFHSQGEEIYCRYGDTPPKGEQMASLFAACTGYVIADTEGLASHGGFKDWFIKEFERPGFTFEIGKGENPLNPAQLDEIYPRLREALMLGIIL